MNPYQDTSPSKLSNSDIRAYIAGVETNELLRTVNTSDRIIPLRPMHSQEKNHVLIWQKKKNNTIFDMEIAQNKKDGKLAPNHYFKIPQKEIMSNKKLVPDDMYTTKLGKVSQLPKTTLVDIIQKRESKKQLGPGVYPVNNLIRASEITTRDQTGVYKKGLCKVNMEQLQFINDAREKSKATPQVGTYKP